MSSYKIASGLLWKLEISLLSIAVSIILGNYGPGGSGGSGGYGGRSRY